jgi:hypothetical protein
MKGNIYCIVDNTNYKYYIGSTTKNIEERLREHEYNCNYYIQGKYNFTSSFEIIQNNNYSIYLIRELEYDDDEEEQLLWLERNFIEDGLREGNCVNERLPITTKEEILEKNKQYKIDNREEIKEQRNQYRNDNRDKINEKFTCPCGGKYTHSNKARHEKSITHKNYITSLSPTEV